MNLNVTFSESNQNLNVSMNENKQSLDVGFGDFQTVHDGQNGATFTPSVSLDGIISWTNDRELPNPEPVNIKGVKGDKGEQGPAGKDGTNGKDGYAPVRGTDYWTDADKAEIKGYVDNAILGGQW